MEGNDENRWANNQGPWRRAVTEQATRIEKIQSRTDLAAFVEELAEGLRSGKVMWENADLPSYLEAMAAWIADMDGYYANIGKSCPEEPSWRTLAEILLAASQYE